MRTLCMWLVSGMVLALATAAPGHPALAQYVYWGAPAYPPYPYRYYPYHYYAPPVIVQVQPGQPAPQFWFYCDSPAGYYPYVPACSTEWRQVPANPPSPGGH